MTSPANLFIEPYGYQFQDGDDWDRRDPVIDGDYWVAFAGDGSRRIVDWERISSQPGNTGQRLYDRTPGLPIHYIRDAAPRASSIRYVDYEWRQTPDATPVNQVPYLQTYQRNAAVSAHDLQVTLGTDVMQSATADDYNTVKNTFIHLIGAAWQRYVEWAAVDPEELIVGGNFDGTPLWSRNLDDHAGDRRGPVRYLRHRQLRPAILLPRQPAPLPAPSPEWDHLLGGPERQPLGGDDLCRSQPAGKPVLRRPGHGLPRGPAVLR